MKRAKIPALCLLALLAPAVLTAQVGLPDYVPVQMDQREEAIFPRALSAVGVKSGAASIAVAIDENGQMTDYLITAYSDPLFAQSALAAVKKWKFEPAQIHGAARSAKADLTFKFEVEGVVVVSVSALTGSDIIKYKLTPNGQAYSACSLAQLDRIPTPTKIVNPPYPTQLARSSRGGKVSVQFYIDEQGHVRMPSVTRETIEANEELASIAVASVAQWQFDPPLQRGRPVLVLAQQDFTFKPAGS
ncbi:MAG TPA: TonB family protein [Opitutaceae bacterium]|jgi:TonB family protein|nr:TonB family protein [Opitutaceae bacterium]